MSNELLYKADNGIRIERLIYDGAGRASVFVITPTGDVLMDYQYNHMEQPLLESPYINWRNLFHVGGWATGDDAYLLKAVQEGTKLCAGITFHSGDEAGQYVCSLPDGYNYHMSLAWSNGPYEFHPVDVFREGAIQDYIDMSLVEQTYQCLGFDDVIDFDEVGELCRAPIKELLDGTRHFDYSNADTVEDLVVAGLLLGYPLESTASLLEDMAY